MRGKQIPSEDVSIISLVGRTRIPFVPSQLRFEQAEPQLPSAPTGVAGGASRRIQGEIRLPPLPPPPPPDIPPMPDNEGISS